MQSAPPESAAPIAGPRGSAEAVGAEAIRLARNAAGAGSGQAGLARLRLFAERSPGQAALY
jgi:hypothetical protein